jgi:hypothetical protein
MFGCAAIIVHPMYRTKRRIDQSAAWCINPDHVEPKLAGVNPDVLACRRAVPRRLSGMSSSPSAIYLSSQTSSMRQLLMILLTIIVQPFTGGCQQ